MVLIITGSAEPGRNTLGRRLAEALGWEFADAENLRPPGHPDAPNCNPSLVTADSPSRIETLSAAINFWIYDWRDVVISCPMLTETERKQLSKMSSLVKIVCLEVSERTGPTRVLDQPLRVTSSEFSAGWRAARDAGPDVLTVDSSRQVEEIVAEMTAVLIMRKSPWLARN
jgi:gluconokinase